jgi:type I restriction enzyme S subunit
MFGDPVCNPKKFPIFKLSEAYINTKEGTKCGPFGSALKKEEYTEKGIPVWVMDNIQGHNFVYKKCLFITNEKFLSLNNYLTQSGDIIISRAGTVGKMCVIPDCYNKAIISTNLIRLRLNIKVLLPLFFVLLMKYFTDRIGRIKTGPDGAFTHMNTGVLNDLTFPFPPITLQNQFAEKIQAIEAQKQQAQASLEKSETLFNSLLQRAFKGELTT